VAAARGPARRAALAALSLALLPRPPAAQPAEPLPIARVSYAEGVVDIARPAKAFARVADGALLRSGDRLRTGPSGTARIEFPWMAVTVSAGSVLSIPETMVLATLLEEGRVDQSAEAGDLLKLVTEEAQVRGEGRVVVWRDRTTTSVSALRGAFTVEGKGGSVSLEAGQGTVVRRGAAPSRPAPLPEMPTGLDPGDDALYVAPGEPVELRWNSPFTAHHLEILPIHSNEVLIAREVDASPFTIAIPWQGMFRWRVASRDAKGIEGLPSMEGLIAVVEKR
jgi:hypothetical protein